MSGTNFLGLGGLIATLLGLLLYGRHLGKKDSQSKVAEVKAEKKDLEVRSSVATASNAASVESARAQAEAKADYRNSHKDIEQARKEGDEGKASMIASQSAQKAIGKGAVARK